MLSVFINKQLKYWNFSSYPEFEFVKVVVFDIDWIVSLICRHSTNNSNLYPISFWMCRWGWVVFVWLIRVLTNSNFRISLNSIKRPSLTVHPHSQIPKLLQSTHTHTLSLTLSLSLSLFLSLTLSFSLSLSLSLSLSPHIDLAFFASLL
jgi:hypothetical protein